MKHSSEAVKDRGGRRVRSCGLLAIAALYASGPGHAIGMQLPTEGAPARERSNHPAEQAQPHATASHGHSGAVNPAPATISLRNGILTITAENSDLNQILNELATITGMTVEGNTRTSRVFGVYGPHSPREVLAELLRGSGYNFVMTGSARDGAPQALVLTAEKTASPPSAQANSSRSTAAAGAKADEEPPDPNAPGPGAIIHVPPPPPEDPQERSKQNLQRLSHIHDQMKQANPPQ